MAGGSGGNVARREWFVWHWTRGVLAAVISIVMFAMMMLTVADVTTRALFNKPVPGSFEISTYLLAILVFASLPLVTWDEQHVKVNLFDHLVPDALKLPLDAVLSLISTVVVAVITYRLWIQGDLMARGQAVTGFLEWPIAPVPYFMSVMSAITTLTLVVLTWQKFTGHATRARAGEADRDFSGLD
jgi:TRAP-type C4-dicarboxylate transport system permease small subunit